ncbi:MAG TPA: RagB/SusD family nutrient uptake outer membrane protein [Flavobacteriaceae bacterium]|nr:RagB/SusD family nutrient uptake outer membrane protein [Flavobacteriaceae bacterium]
MKKFKFYLLILSLLLVFTSCEDDIINLEPTDFLPTNIAVANIEGLETSMLSVYVQARSLHENNEISLYKQCGTDIVTSGTHMVDVNTGGMLGMMEYGNGFDASSGSLEDIFNGLYLSLDRCNVVIAYGGNFEADSPAEEERKNKIIGEAYALRAYVYLELAERWDNAVITELAETVDDIVFTADLSGRDALMQQVVDDATAAVPLLKSRMENGDVGAPSKDLAYLLLAKAQMWLGNYPEAAAAAEGVLAQGGILQPLDGIFGTEGGKTGEENNAELIFSWIFNPADQNRPQRTVQMYVPLYDRVPGVARTLEQGGRPWSRLSPSAYYWTLFEEGDGRLDAWHISRWLVDDPDNIDPSFGDIQEGDYLTVESEYFQNWASNDREARYLEPTTTKTWEDATYGRLASEAQGFRNVIVYRLTEAYIIGAEAHWRNGNDARALQLLNTLRERAFGDSSHNFGSVDLETIIEEHARELGHEGHRWAFLKRLGLLIERTRMYNPSASPNIQDKHVRWPIPQNFVDQLGVDQNDGY